MIINKRIGFDVIISLLEEVVINNIRNVKWVCDYLVLNKENVIFEIIIKAVFFKECGMILVFRKFLNYCLGFRIK